MQIRANQVYHIDQILDIAKAVCFADDKLNLVVGSFNSGIAHPKAYGIQYMILVPFYLLVEFIHSRNTAVRCPPQPMFQLDLCFAQVFQIL